jgi:periplasmic divalent cation tolerance protein
MKKIYLFYVTFPNRKSALKIARQLFEQKLIACAQIFPPSESMYVWKSKLVKEKEVIALFKTNTINHKLCRKFLIENHPYDIPCILVSEWKSGDPSYAHWVSEVTKNLGV